MRAERRGRGKEDVPEEAPEVELFGLLAEFRSALRQEIDASRKANAASAVALVNGRRIGQLGSAYQYVFEVENALNSLPGDAPGDLIVGGTRRPLEVTVIAIEGLSITLSVGSDLGAFVPNAKLQSNLAHLMRKLIERIEGLADVPNEAGGRILGETEPSGEPESIPAGDPGNGQRLNEEQHAAVESALGRNTTFIWGPPGTGKTKTIGAIGGHAVDRQDSVLMVSHTNTAVDQALMQIARHVRATRPELVSEGKILRVGEPRDQQVKGDVELLASTHVERRSAELIARRDEATAARAVAVKRVGEVAHFIDIAEWIKASAADIAKMGTDLAEVHELEATSREVREEADRREAERPDLETRVREARRALRAADALATDTKAVRALEARVEASRVAVTDAGARAERASEDQAVAERLEPTRSRLDELPGLDEARAQHAEVTHEHQQQSDEANTVEETLAGVKDQLAEAESVGGLTRRWRRLPAPEVLAERVSGLETQLTNGNAALEGSRSRLDAAGAQLAEVERLCAEVAGHEKLPRLNEATTARDKLESELRHAVTAVSEREQALTTMRSRVGESQQILGSFVSTYHGAPAEIQAAARRSLDEIVAAAELARKTWRDTTDARSDLEGEVRERLAIVREWGLSRRVSGRAEEMLAAITEAVDAARSIIAGQDVLSLRAEHSALQAEIRTLDGTLEEIAEQLEKVEELVIADALVVATTLTRAYLRDSVWKRTYDTVILDEASMAPIPAMWAVASRAERAVVVVGDFLQLPPIVIAREEEAQKWLGRDLFTVTGLDSPTCDAEHFVKLRRQYRMHPAVSAIPNALFYGGLLKDDHSASSDDELAGWYRRDWGHDEPVLLVDTAPTNAWVTSVARGGGSSRLNFLSATTCVDLAEQFLEGGRKPFEPGDPPRVAIICPYRPHAQLLELLLRDQGLSGEVVAGTAHIFQGTEAPVVILDTVNDEPHWRVGMFRPDADENTKRILNVAITRARRRLVVVGDFDYMAGISKKSFFGREFLVKLGEYPRVSALDVVPVGLGVRAAKAQTAATGGAVEADRDRLVVTQEHFYPLLRTDLANAKTRVVIYSPFITENRLGQLQTSLLSAVERGVSVFVVTKTITDRGERDKPTYRSLNRTMTDWGVVVIPKAKMHEKFIFIDDDLTWVGSLNPLSYSDTQETVERRKSAAVSADYAKTLRLSELVREYRDGRPVCPICGTEMYAAEGRDDPYFWRCCEDGCYSRSIDAPQMGDEILCNNCAAPVKFGKWGEEDSWRCSENPRHHQKVARPHLRLPKMQAVIPKDDLRRLAKKWNLDISTGASSGRLF